MKLISNLRPDKKNYSVSEWGSIQLGILYGFLENTYLLDPNDTINWLIHPDKIISLSGNLINAYFDENNKCFILSDLFFEGDDEKDNELIVAQDEIIKIVMKWEKLLQQKPDQIIITDNNNGTFTLTGKFVDGREI